MLGELENKLILVVCLTDVLPQIIQSTIVLPTMEVTMIKEKKQVQMIWSTVQDDEMSRSLKANAVVYDNYFILHGVS